MLDGNEHAACEAVGQAFESLLQYQLPVTAGRSQVSKTSTLGFDTLHRCHHQAAHGKPWAAFFVPKSVLRLGS